MKSERGRGRPKLPKNERRGVKVPVMLSPEDARGMDAARGDVSRSSWVLALIRRALRR
jgi:hypothetical protein